VQCFCAMLWLGIVLMLLGHVLCICPGSCPGPCPGQCSWTMSCAMSCPMSCAVSWVMSWTMSWSMFLDHVLCYAVLHTSCLIACDHETPFFLACSDTCAFCTSTSPASFKCMPQGKDQCLVSLHQGQAWQWPSALLFTIA
jgi:hypothetical protein